MVSGGGAAAGPAASSTGCPSLRISLSIYLSRTATQGAPGRVIRLQSSDSVQVLGLCGVGWGALGLGGGRVARRVSPCPAPAVARSIADVSRGKIIFRTFRPMRAAFVLFLRCACVCFPCVMCTKYFKALRMALRLLGFSFLPDTRRDAQAHLAAQLHLQVQIFC